MMIIRRALMLTLVVPFVVLPAATASAAATPWPVPAANVITIPADAPLADPADVMPIPEAAIAQPVESVAPQIVVPTDATPADPEYDLPIQVGQGRVVGDGDMVPAGQVLASASLDQVVSNIRTWIVGMLAALATLFLTIGGLRYLMAGGDPAEVEKAKTALKSSMIGYSLAVLAPVLMDVLKSMLGA